MTTMHVVFIISFAVMEILATSTLSAATTEKTQEVLPLKTTGKPVSTSKFTSTSPKTIHTTTTGKITSLNNTATRIGKIIETDRAPNSSIISPPANIVLKTNLNDSRLDIGETKKESLKSSQVTRIHDKERNMLKNLFDKMLAYKHLHLQGVDERDRFIREYTLLIKKKYLYRQGNRPQPLRRPKEGSTIKRKKRSIKESAGYTHDLDVCKHYNDNLIVMWSKLSKYIDNANQSLPSKSVLHNIGIMLRAYLDHVDPVEIYRQSLTTNTDTRKQKRIDIEDALTPIIREIKHKIDVNVNSKNGVENLIKLVIDAFRKFKGDETTECAYRKETEIASLINLAYQQFLLKVNCDNNSNANDIQTIDNYFSNANPNNNMKSEPNQLNIKSSFSLKKIKRSAEMDFLHFNSNDSIYKAIIPLLKANNKNANHYINSNITPSNLNVLSSTGISSSRPNNTFYMTDISSRRKVLNIEYCIKITTDQFLSVLKFILIKYLQYDDCQKYGTTKIGIEKLIESTLGYQPPNNKKDKNISKYRDLLRLLVNMQVRYLNHIFKTPTEEVKNNVINKQALKDFLRDINNLDALMNYTPQHNIEPLLINENTLYDSFVVNNNPLAPTNTNYFTEEKKVKNSEDTKSYPDVLDLDSTLDDRNNKKSSMVTDKKIPVQLKYLNPVDDTILIPPQSPDDALGLRSHFSHDSRKSTPDKIDHKSINYSKVRPDNENIYSLDHLLEPFQFNIVNDQLGISVKSDKNNHPLQNIPPLEPVMIPYDNYKLPDFKYQTPKNEDGNKNYDAVLSHVLPIRYEKNVMDNQFKILNSSKDFNLPLKPFIFKDRKVDDTITPKKSPNVHDIFFPSFNQTSKNNVSHIPVNIIKSWFENKRNPKQSELRLSRENNYKRNSVNYADLSTPEKMNIPNEEETSVKTNFSASKINLLNLESNRDIPNMNISYAETKRFEKKDDETSKTDSLHNIYDETLLKRLSKPEATRSAVKITAHDYLPIISSDYSSDGDVELIHVYKHPQVVLFQPQALVKRRMSYYDYIKNFQNIFSDAETNNQHLYLKKILRYFPNNKVQVLYDSDSEYPDLKIVNTITSGPIN